MWTQQYQNPTNFELCNLDLVTLSLEHSAILQVQFWKQIIEFVSPMKN